jgi:hypothetical protein
LHRKRQRGRPSKYTPEIEANLIRLLPDFRLAKTVIARKLGVPYMTLIGWQYTQPMVRILLEDRQRYRRLRGLDDILARMVKRNHNRRPYGNRRPIVTKQVRLVCWYLLYRIPIGWAITEGDERDACLKFNLNWELWERAKWLKPLIKTVLEKRERRKAFLVANGWIYKGWTPPKPGEKERCSPDWWRSRPEYND